MKRIAPLLATAAALALSLSACGSSGDNTTSTEGKDALQQIKESGVLTVGTEGTYRPFSYNEGSELTGYDVEVIKAVGEKMGVEVKFQQTQWDAIFAGLDAGRFDVIANQVAVNPEREAKYLFSEPYTVSTGVIVTKSDNTDITSFESLKGKKTAQSLTSNYYETAKAAGATVEPVEGWAQAVTLLKQGRVDATVNDKLTFLDAQKTHPDDSIKIAAEATEKTDSAVAMRKDETALQGAINDALDQLRADGELAKISEKYFGEDVSK
ncbi:amino acid ABC transporter substrate-binding protein [Glutamicibacter protophormiae]|uniref:Cystine transport system substrate-binding protein n=1 Tax=Glutamicibacter protophormiae TaxID=37930 RepID=A0ABS4XKK4_GLUPR|nr:amino acid ABC transporter substrate-binding protein [Glutamicibacter protophormiae]MBP2397030.1 cystine transport system substrate-binding protein [Glutamicibacter protophormiae]QRQ77855.1 amino acid ABC transporter substrate-binding protein [Glutamicibacter protophormiae]WPR63872.1 amino acid ABC transporter substrate-binding protein [Glutamicibacter protophormiae]WPR67367.1 amino acid ABC transporter substrate-binding protein [Glutamicibacter protophormiae]GGL91993.1 amino acid ABC trans